MKKIILIALLIFSNIVFAQESSLSIFSENGDEFYLILNNIRQNEHPETNIRVDGLTNEYYSAKIIFENKNISPLEKKYMSVVDVDNKKGKITYKIKEKQNGKLVLRFYSFTPFREVLPLRENVTIIHYNTVPMPEIGIITETTTTSNNRDNFNLGVGINTEGVNIGVNINVNDGYSNTSSTTTTTTTTTSNIPQEVIFVEEINDCYTLNNADFYDALESIKNKTFSSSKLTIAKQVARNNCLTAKQIKKIVKLFDFESTKLEFAKYAYPFCYNPENYWKINDAFEFEQSIEELEEFTRS